MNNINIPDDDGKFWVDVGDFTDRLCERIDPEWYFRLQELMLTEGKDPQRDFDPDDPPCCALEMKDEPAFRELIVNGTDSMEKGREWITFDNGESYYMVREVKELMNGVLDKDHYTYTDELKKILEFYL